MECVLCISFLIFTSKRLLLKIKERYCVILVWPKNTLHYKISKLFCDLYDFTVLHNTNNFDGFALNFLTTQLKHYLTVSICDFIHSNQDVSIFLQINFFINSSTSFLCR